MISKRLCIKYGPHTHLSEASTMRFATAHTSISVPKVYCAFTLHGWTYIVMERMAGDMIARGWIYRSAKSKADVLSQVKQMIQEMLSIRPTDVGITNVD